MQTALRARWAALLAASWTLFVACDVWAQSSPILPSTRVFVVGPLSLYPQVALREAGTDSNVFNESTSPRSDMTYSLTPRLFAVVPIGNTRFVGTGMGEFVYYRTYTDQRSLTGQFDGRYEVTEAVFRPFVSGGFVMRGDREGYEIDARVRRTQVNAMMGADIDVTAITALTGWVARSKSSYDDDEDYLSFALANQLNHKTDVIAGGAKFRVTPLTTILIAAEFERERFERSPLRDADGMRLAPAVAFETGGAITGDMKAGFRSFTPRAAAIPSFRGFVGEARLHYALPSVIRIDLEANRDVEFSYDPTQPYYLESGGRVTVTQHIVGPLEVIGIGERRETRNQRVGGSVSFDGRREVTTSLGGGIGFQIQTQMRFALTYERTERTSTQPVGRNYERTQVLGSIHYGL